MIDLITGHQGVSHISAEQVANIQNAEMAGYGDHKVMRMSGGAVSYAGLTISVATGYWRVNGYDMEIKEAEDLIIDPTAAGNHRIDKIFVEILQDIPSGAQRSELRVVQGEESSSTPSAPATPTDPFLNTDLLLQIEEVCTVTVSDGSMTFSDSTISFEIVTPAQLAAVEAKAEAAETMIAPIEASSTASQDYTVGKQLVYNGLLYTVSAAITQGDTLTPGTNITLSDDVTTQLETLNGKTSKYGTSSTAASTTAKVASTTNGDFVLQTGSTVRIKFSSSNTATSPTLNVDSTGAHSIKGYSTTKPDIWWEAGDVVEFTYNGTNFIMGATQGQITTLNSSLTDITTFDITPVSTYLKKNATWSGQSYRVGHLVFVNIAFDIVANASGQTVATIPTGFRPKYTQTINLGLDGNLIRIDTNGNILGYLTTSTAHLTLNMVYYAD